jgi:hypothetical protein
MWLSSKDVRRKKTAKLGHVRIYGKADGGMSVVHHDRGDGDATETHKFDDSEEAKGHLLKLVDDHFASARNQDDAEEEQLWRKM